jgi:hypothetical protein
MTNSSLTCGQRQKSKHSGMAAHNFRRCVHDRDFVAWLADVLRVDGHDGDFNVDCDKRDQEMSDFILWMIVIPVLVFAVKFWFGVAKWLLRNKQTFGGRVQRVRAAFDEGMRREE